MQGVLLVNKPKGPTSHDVVARLRRVAATRRVGHAGTLDPMAEGLLVVCIGRATRIVPWLVGLPKEYAGEMKLGGVSDTYDAEGEIVMADDPPQIDETLLREAMRKETGLVEQTAPPYSAVKVDGRKLYEYARAGEEVPRKTRTVWIERFDLVRYLPPRALFVACVGSGTYVRSMAHETGRRLGCGAYLTALCRTSVGAFHLDQAVSLDALEADPEHALPEALLSIPEALGHLPKLIVLPTVEALLRNGRPFTLGGVLDCPGPQPVGEPCLALSDRGEALAIVQCEAAGSPYRPLRVFPADEE